METNPLISTFIRFDSLGQRDAGWRYALPADRVAFHDDPIELEDYSYNLQTDTGYCADPGSDPATSHSGTRGTCSTRGTCGTGGDDGGPGPGTGGYC